MDIQSSLYKFCKEKNIDKVLRMDNDITYWNISDKYTGDNKTQMKLKELKKLYEYYCDKIKLIDKCYTNDTVLLIISHDKLELLYGLFVCFMIKYADLPLNKSMMSAKNKIGLTIQISRKLTDLLKYYKSQNDKHK